MEPKKHAAPLPAMEVSLFCSQAAMILASDVPLHEGMEVLAGSYADTPYSGSIKTVYEAVDAGSTLYEGLEQAGAFPDYMMQMVRVSEKTGDLDTVLGWLAVYYEKESRLREDVRSAVTYPLVLVAMLAVVIGILVLRVLPIFASVFRGLGGGVSGAAGAVLSGGVVLGRVMLVLVALLLVAVLGVFLAWRAGKQRQVLDAAAKLVPRIDRLRRQQAAQRFCSVMAMVLASDCGMDEALELLPGLLQGGPGEAAAETFRQRIAEEGDIGRAVRGLGLFEPLHEKMIGVGAGTGQTDQVFSKLADLYDHEVEAGIQGLTASIEPALVAALTVIIGGILLSVMLPLAGIMSSMM